MPVVAATRGYPHPAARLRRSPRYAWRLRGMASGREQSLGKPRFGARIQMRVTLEINIRTAGRWVLGLLLLWAALSKLANPQEFFTSVLGYRLPLGPGLGQMTAVVLPWLELLCGLLLLANLMAGPALVWSTVLFCIFVLVTGQAWLRGLDISCGCFNFSALGLSDTSLLAQWMHSTFWAFVRAMALAALSIDLLRREIASSPATA